MSEFIASGEWYFSTVNRNIENRAKFMLINSYPRFPLFSLYFRCELGVTFSRRCFRNVYFLAYFTFSLTPSLTHFTNDIHNHNHVQLNNNNNDNDNNDNFISFTHSLTHLTTTTTSMCNLIIIIMIILIMITLFQEDNIFGTNASLTYGPQLQYMRETVTYLQYVPSS